MATGRKTGFPAAVVAALAAAVAAALSIALVPARADVIIIVTTTADVIANDGACSLREAITAANNNGNYFGCTGSGGGYDLIEFSVGAGTPLISVATDLPVITGPLEINGGASRVEVRGPGTGTGLKVSGAGAAGSVIRNLVLDGFATAIFVDTTTSVTIAGNRIGTNAAGTATAGNATGVLVSAATAQVGGTVGVTPGGTCTGDCNLISGNLGQGVDVRLAGNATVRGNSIGTNAAGTSAIPNGHGIRINDAALATIGGTATGAGNLISGNTGGDGIRLLITANAAGSTIQGNRIGTNAAGTAAVPNTNGINISLGNRTYPVTIGGSVAGAGNVVAGNTAVGIKLITADGVTMYGNRIGTRPDGITSLPNGGSGVELSSSTHNNVIGGVAAGQGNIIANNATGVLIGIFDYNNSVRGNSIRSNTGKGISLLDNQDSTAFAPLITGVSPVSGTACPGCVVDVYSDAVDEGATYHGTVTADGGGNWTYGGGTTGAFVTATATGATLSTSEFSAAFPAAPPDTDSDGVPDFGDNCKLLANPTQCDSDGDGYGNRCDGDLNNNDFTNAQDTVLYRAQLSKPSDPPTFNPADLNCNGFVNAQDTTLFRGLLGAPPGPAGP